MAFRFLCLAFLFVYSTEQLNSAVNAYAPKNFLKDLIAKQLNESKGKIEHDSDMYDIDHSIKEREDDKDSVEIVGIQYSGNETLKKEELDVYLAGKTKLDVRKANLKKKREELNQFRLKAYDTFKEVIAERRNRKKVLECKLSDLFDELKVLSDYSTLIDERKRQLEHQDSVLVAVNNGEQFASRNIFKLNDSALQQKNKQLDALQKEKKNLETKYQAFTGEIAAITKGLEGLRRVIESPEKPKLIERDYRSLLGYIQNRRNVSLQLVELENLRINIKNEINEYGLSMETLSSGEYREQYIRQQESNRRKVVERTKEINEEAVKEYQTVFDALDIDIKEITNTRNIYREELYTLNHAREPEVDPLNQEAAMDKDITEEEKEIKIEVEKLNSLRKALLGDASGIQTPK